MKDKLDKLDKLLHRVEEEIESNANELRKLSEMLEPLLDQVEGLKNLDIKLSLKAGRLRADANELKQLIKSAERFETNYKEDPKIQQTLSSRSAPWIVRGKPYRYPAKYVVRCLVYVGDAFRWTHFNRHAGYIGTEFIGDFLYAINDPYAIHIVAFLWFLYAALAAGMLLYFFRLLSSKKC